MTNFDTQCIERELQILSELLSDGRPRSRVEIIAATGLDELPPSVWRHFPKLPDGRHTLPDSEGAWDFLINYLREKPRRLPVLLRLFRRHKEIATRLAAENDREPFVRLPRALITTTDSPEGRNELERRRQVQLCRDTLESLHQPFFIPERLELDPKAFQEIADSYTVTVGFKGKKLRCLRREFPGEVLVEQLAEICSRYFAPPHMAAGPIFLKENSYGKRESANILGVDNSLLTHLTKNGELDHFFLDGRLRLWRSDVKELKKDEARLHKLFNEDKKLKKYWHKHKSGEVSGERQTLVVKRPPRQRKILPPESGELILDDFQRRATEALQMGQSVLVAAPTGNGKTLVAEMLAKSLMTKGHGMVYTSPLKALSNQKYRDFREQFGEEQVGLVTGDISINPGAPMLIMTTEIFRNWCLSEPEQLEKTSYVVFDEIHYLDDAERGTTWEESILFAPPHIKFLGLSATVPNIKEMANWIGSVRKEKVIVIQENRRHVPLKVRWLLPNGKITLEKETRKELQELAGHLKTQRNRSYS